MKKAEFVAAFRQQLRLRYEQQPQAYQAAVDAFGACYWEHNLQQTNYACWSAIYEEAGQQALAAIAKQASKKNKFP